MANAKKTEHGFANLFQGYNTSKGFVSSQDLEGMPPEERAALLATADQRPVRAAQRGATVVSSHTRAVRVNAPTVELIPDYLHREFTRMAMDALEPSGCFEFKKARNKFGVAVDAIHIDLVRRWIEEHSKDEEPEYQLFPVTAKFWSNGAAANPDTLAVGQGYLVTGGRRGVGGWVSTKADNGKYVVRAALKIGAKIVEGVLDSVENKSNLSGQVDIEDAAKRARHGLSGVNYDRLS